VAFGIKTDHNFSLFVTPKGKEGLILGLVFSDKIHTLLIIVGDKDKEIIHIFTNYYYFLPFSIANPK
jgi:hypothetical protein